ncbi:MAG: hypothetical protein FH751_07700 [Firmicutes bacterium]|nr:hypothetical protein [Bacillota bacterium]
MINNKKFELLETILEFINDNYFSPTTTELTNILDIETEEKTSELLKELENLGLIEKKHSKSRNLALTYKGRKLLSNNMR